MKKISLMLVLAGIFSSLVCQTDNPKVLNSEICYRFDEDSNIWLFKWSGKYTYDTLGNQIMEEIDYWCDDPNNPEKSCLDRCDKRIVSVFDTDGNLVEKLGLNWFEETGEWQDRDRVPVYQIRYLAYRILYEYDEVGRLVESNDYTKDENNNWVLGNGHWETPDNEDIGYRRLYSYDTTGILLEKLEIPYDSNNFWQDNAYRYTYEYDANGSLSQEIHYIRPMDSIDWRMYRTDTYAYDPQGKVKHICKDWMDRNLHITTKDSIKYRYDGSGNLSRIETFRHSWDEENLVWKEIGDNPEETRFFNEDELITKTLRSGALSVSYWSDLNTPTSVNIPDTVLLHALIEQGVDTDGDSLISFSEAAAITTLDVSSTADNPGKITDLTGIEAFLNLDTLNCHYNRISNLDVSAITGLRLLWCGGNQLSTLDVSGCTQLQELRPGANQLTSLDLSKNTDLREYWGADNQLTSIDISNNTQLTFFACDKNKISGLDVSKNRSLKVLWVANNLLTTLDLSNNHHLEELYAYNNQLMSLDVSGATQINRLSCDFNQLTELDVTNNTSLVILTCNGNQLETLDLRKNTLLTNLRLKDMSTLGRVCVWPSFPEGVSVNTGGSPNVNFIDCTPPVLTFPDSAPDSLYQPTTVDAESSENGVIYIVPESTAKNLDSIQALKLDSVEVFAKTVVSISLSDYTNGTYWLYARDATGNLSDPKSFTILGVGIQLPANGQCRIYPNPVKDFLNIKTDKEASCSVEIFTQIGQIIYRSTLKGRLHQIDMSSIQKGIYFITIKSGGFTSTTKIIKS